MTTKADISGTTRTKTQLQWVEYLKAIALIWIFLNHIAERLFGFPYMANPTVDWPPFQERLQQLQPLDAYGVLDVPLNLLRYVGWFGDQGVQLFIIMSGFGLTWGLLARHTGTIPLRQFYLRRALRIYPLWWGIHLLVLPLILFVTVQFGGFDTSYFLSLLGIRFLPSTYAAIVSAWWYIGLLIQLYLIFPFLWLACQRWGFYRVLIAVSAAAFIIRGVGLFAFEGYLDQWHRGAIFVTRLPEFALGMGLAVWLHEAGPSADGLLRRRTTVAAAAAVYGAGLALSLTLLGMTIATFMLGAGMFVLLYALLGGSQSSAPANAGTRSLNWIGQHSYSLYLVHHLVIILVIPATAAPDSLRAFTGIVAAVIASVAGAVVLERLVGYASQVISGWHQSAGIRGAGLRLAAIFTVAAAMAIGSELIVRQLAPQEVNGWGERPSLQLDADFGWTLRPAAETRLRWETYDYRVTANALGFPGPEYPAESAPDTVRIMTIGDAFTSAEGVDTAQAWPRLLEQYLADTSPDSDVQVLNFAVTGYGPNQYAAVLDHYVPVYQPDVIIIGFFVNEYFDVLTSTADFQNEIGFNQRSQSSPIAVLNLLHLRRYVSLYWVEPLGELWNGHPRDHGYFLGNFRSLERDNMAATAAAVPLVRERLAEIKQTADAVNADLILLMIPASVQVCVADQLDYYPRHVDLTDDARFDLDLPQQLTREIAADLDLAFYDLRPVLAAGDCPYFANNMHWTAVGHRAVAGYAADVLVRDHRIFER